MEEVDEYLWEVYQRTAVKSDSSGDFTWKDMAAAKRAGMSVRDYVIGGMDADFREQLYHAGRAMDSNGINWSMLSAFRDTAKLKRITVRLSRHAPRLHALREHTGPGHRASSSRRA